MGQESFSYNASVATIQESLRRERWLIEGPTQKASVATIQESLRRNHAIELLPSIVCISRHDSGELEAVSIAPVVVVLPSHQSPRFRRA